MLKVTSERYQKQKGVASRKSLLNGLFFHTYNTMDKSAPYIRALAIHYPASVLCV